jgi:adenosylcobinamide kinase/adenosylcobinamide-phosphate guanylyltransferase
LAKIIFIIGGARSGKSSFTLKEASIIKGKKAFIATAQAFDSEMKERIERHKKERWDDWDTFEEPVNITDVLLDIKNKYSVIVLDCLTLWLSNILHRAPRKASQRGRQSTEHRTQMIENNIQEFINELKTLKDSSRITHYALRLFVVSNEVGMGIVPDNKMARSFRDLVGYLNQKVAEVADEVYLLTAGIPIKIKNAK